MIDLTPRVGSLDIFANIGLPKGETFIILLYSKKLSGIWPNIETVAKRGLEALNEAVAGIELIEIEANYSAKVYLDKKEAEFNESLKDMQSTLFNTI